MNYTKIILAIETAMATPMDENIKKFSAVQNGFKTRYLSTISRSIASSIIPWCVF